jgi:hypothetical protein
VILSITQRNKWLNKLLAYYYKALLQKNTPYN